MYVRGKLEKLPLTQCLPLATIQAPGLQNEVEKMCTVYEAVISENHTLVNSGASIVYLDSQHKVLMFDV